MPSTEQPSVHVLGGGVGAMTAAYHLSSGDWQRRYGSITIYQMGWRLGGKGASGWTAPSGSNGSGGGSQPQHPRAEEHGLHVWFGFYENAFRILQACHTELDALERRGEPRWNLPFRSVEESFHHVDRVGLMESGGPDWIPWVAEFPERPGLPWDRDLRREPLTWSASDILRPLASHVLDLAASVLESLEGGFVSDRAVDDASDHAARLAATGLRLISDGLGSSPGQMLRDVLVDQAAPRLDRGATTDDLVERALRLADAILDRIEARIARAMWLNEEVRRLHHVLEVAVAVLRGLVADGVVDEASLDRLDIVDFRTWLRSHGASRAAADTAVIRAVCYDLAFAYRKGDKDDPQGAAGTAIRGLFRLLFTYRGHLMWKMNGPMGDVVFGPLYELLVKRGVTFRFFHKVTALRLDPEMPHRVRSIELVDQTPRGRPDGAPGSMLVEVETPQRTFLGWPATPSVQEEGPAPSVQEERPAPSVREERSARELESNWIVDGTSLKVPVGSDDVVILGISLGALPHVAGELLAESSEWRDCVERVRTVPTKALQLWYPESAEELGWESDAIVGGFRAPFDTYSDMPAIVELEARPGVRSLAYLCSVTEEQDAFTMPGDRIPSAGAQELRHHHEQAYAKADEIREQLPTDFRIDSARLLFDSPGGAVETESYARVNIEPSDRYVLSVPGSSRYRIRPDDSGFSNVYPVGDWTECTINAGCVEAATISGMLAARALGATSAERIVGERRIPDRLRS